RRGRVVVGGDVVSGVLERVVGRRRGLADGRRGRDRPAAGGAGDPVDARDGLRGLEIRRQFHAGGLVRGERLLGRGGRRHRAVGGGEAARRFRRGPFGGLVQRRGGAGRHAERRGGAGGRPPPAPLDTARPHRDARPPVG